MDIHLIHTTDRNPHIWNVKEYLYAGRNFFCAQGFFSFLGTKTKRRTDCLGTTGTLWNMVNFALE